MALTPQIVLPNPEPPKIKNPTLPVAMTTYGDPSLRMPKGPIGDPTGVPAPPSPGPGTGGGIGRSTGTGVGGGTGGGAGPGRGGNAGGGDMGLGGGRSIEPMTASLRPTILYREKAKYTEEARQNKIQGIVVLQVVFNVNQQITDIRVIRGLPDGLTEKAIEAAKKIRFNPAVRMARRSACADSSNSRSTSINLSEQSKVISPFYVHHQAGKTSGSNNSGSDPLIGIGAVARLSVAGAGTAWRAGATTS